MGKRPLVKYESVYTFNPKHVPTCVKYWFIFLNIFDWFFREGRWTRHGGTTINMLNSTYLFLVVVFQCRLKSFLQSFKHKLHIITPPDLWSSESNLSREIKNPLLSGSVLVHRHSFKQVAPDRFLHGFFKTSKPSLHLIIRVFTSGCDFLKCDG